MTGYTVHTGTSEKFSAGWDNIFAKTKKTTKKAATVAKKPAAAKAKKVAASGKKATAKVKRGK